MHRCVRRAADGRVVARLRAHTRRLVASRRRHDAASKRGVKRVHISDCRMSRDQHNSSIVHNDHKLLYSRPSNVHNRAMLGTTTPLTRQKNQNSHACRFRSSPRALPPLHTVASPLAAVTLELAVTGSTRADHLAVARSRDSTRDSSKVSLRSINSIDRIVSNVSSCVELYRAHQEVKTGDDNKEAAPCEDNRAAT